MCIGVGLLVASLADHQQPTEQQTLIGSFVATVAIPQTLHMNLHPMEAGPVVPGDYEFGVAEAGQPGNPVCVVPFHVTDAVAAP